MTTEEVVCLTLDDLGSEKLTTKDLYNLKFDDVEVELARHPQAEMPVENFFTPGLYIRQIFMPKGTLVTSLIHKTEHPFVVSQGIVSVFNEGAIDLIKAPHHGITYPGTRRILYIHEDCVWTTYHVTTETDPEKIVEQITEKRDSYETVRELVGNLAFEQQKEIS
jgi:hypothetical protein